MLVTMPDTLYGRLGALLCALIVVASVIGLTMHKDFYAGRPRKGFFCFYTNISNFLVWVYFALVSPRLYARAGGQALIARAEFSLMMSIMLTFCVFHLLLYPPIRQSIASMAHTRTYWIVCTDNVIIHYIVPWLVFLYWLLCSPKKNAIGASDALLWTLLPLGYVLFILIRAALGYTIEETQSPYPYPFLNIRDLGAKRVLLICTALYGACAAAGAAAVLIVHFLFAVFGSGHALILI